MQIPHDTSVGHVVKWTAGALALCLLHSIVEIISSVITTLSTTKKEMDLKALPPC